MLPTPRDGFRVCYMAGPMTGLPGYNRLAFEEATAYWRQAGWTVNSPIEFDDKTFGSPDLASEVESYAMLLRRDLDLIAQSDIIAVLPGWENSRGARLEVHWANVIGKPVHDAVTGETVWKRVHDNPPVHVTVNTGEVRVVSATGGAKCQKLARYDLIPPGPLHLLAEHYGKGAAKYGDDNWTKGYDWSLNFAALQRHAWAFWGGEDNDPETGSPHMVAVAWHAFTLLAFATMHPEFDNRRKSHARP